MEAAARRYFGKSARSVTLTQAALLAGLLKAPSRYAPTRSVKLASARVDEVLDNMVEAGFLTEAEASAAATQPLRLQRQRATRPAIPMPSIGWPSCCRNSSATTRAI